MVTVKVGVGVGVSVGPRVAVGELVGVGVLVIMAGGLAGTSVGVGETTSVTDVGLLAPVVVCWPNR